MVYFTLLQSEFTSSKSLIGRRDGSLWCLVPPKVQNKIVEKHSRTPAFFELVWGAWLASGRRRRGWEFLPGKRMTKDGWGTQVDPLASSRRVNTWLSCCCSKSTTSKY